MAHLENPLKQFPLLDGEVVKELMLKHVEEETRNTMERVALRRESVTKR